MLTSRRYVVLGRHGCERGSVVRAGGAASTAARGRRSCRRLQGRAAPRTRRPRPQRRAASAAGRGRRREPPGLAAVDGADTPGRRAPGARQREEGAGGGLLPTRSGEGTPACRATINVERGRAARAPGQPAIRAPRRARQPATDRHDRPDHEFPRPTKRPWINFRRGARLRDERTLSRSPVPTATAPGSVEIYPTKRARDSASTPPCGDAVGSRRPPTGTTGIDAAARRAAVGVQAHRRRRGRASITRFGERRCPPMLGCRDPDADGSAHRRGAVAAAAGRGRGRGRSRWHASPASGQAVVGDRAVVVQPQQRDHVGHVLVAAIGARGVARACRGRPGGSRSGPAS